ncbi:hypothetical protein Q7P37_001939 [Cladosporium fusiforme]
MHRNLILALACASAGANALPNVHERDEASDAGVAPSSTATDESEAATQVAMTAVATATGDAADANDLSSLLQVDPAIVDPAYLEQLQSYAEVCFPNATSGQPDWNAPCNAYAAIEAQCMLGPEGLELLERPPMEILDALTSGDFVNELLDLETQRACLCQSQYLDVSTGCNACSVRMSLVSQEYADRYHDLMKDLMEDYCRVENTPTVPLLALIGQVIADEVTQEITEGGDSLPAWLDSQPSTTSSVDSATDVSNYYTLSVPGSSVYSIPFATPSGNATFTSTRVSGGVIVPTATAAADESGDGQSDEAAEFEGGAAAVGSQAIGMIGFVGFMVVAALL